MADINRAMDPATVFIYGFLFPKIAGVRAVDPGTVEIMLAEPSADLPVSLYKLPIMDPAAVATINEAPIGTVLFVLKEFVPEDRHHAGAQRRLLGHEARRSTRSTSSRRRTRRRP